MVWYFYNCRNTTIYSQKNIFFKGNININIHVLNDNGTTTTHNIDNTSKKSEIEYISSSKKELNAIKIIEQYKSNSKSILYDKTNQTIHNQIQDGIDFEKEDFSMMFFTSGSSGSPVGALKTKENLEEEVKVFSKLIAKYNIKKVIVTVPFIHIYGTLVGLLYPILNNIDIVLKEHFLPNNLLEIIDDNCLVVTTPLYIKALNLVNDKKNLASSLFISSTAPLNDSLITEFNSKFNSNIIQLFGSTETGGIAYKENNSELWTPLEGVNISINEHNELKIQSAFLSNTLFENVFRNIPEVFQTFDFVEIIENKFKLVGRSNKILKIAGKRYSTIQIENILEDIDEISKAIVFVKKSDDGFKDEIIDITLESSKEFTKLEIVKVLKSKLSNLKFKITLNYVEKINVTQIGKKVLPRSV